MSTPLEKLEQQYAAEVMKSDADEGLLKRLERGIRGLKGVAESTGMTTAFADHPLQKLSSNIGNFGAFGLIHIAGPSTQVSIQHHCCKLVLF
ncbi:TPA: hypothetical protein ACH3X1_014444 [Trebouxia sp. C0004]